MADDADEGDKPSAKDVVLLGPPTADGNGVHVLRARDEKIEAGELRALREGQPIVGEIVSLEPRKDNPRLCDVASSYAPKTTATPKALAPSSSSSKKGPAQVASKAYRDNWDELFGTRDRSVVN